MKTYNSSIDQLSLKREKSNFPKAKIITSSDAAQYARQFYFDDLDIYESMFLILLNNSNNTIGFVKISQGGITGTVVDVRIIAKYAIETLATGIILVHNHPSGNTTPSSADTKITAKVKQGLALLDVTLTDHLIITSSSYFSFADEGLL